MMLKSNNYKLIQLQTIKEDAKLDNLKKSKPNLEIKKNHEKQINTTVMGTTNHSSKLASNKSLQMISSDFKVKSGQNNPEISANPQQKQTKRKQKLQKKCQPLFPARKIQKIPEEVKQYSSQQLLQQKSPELSDDDFNIRISQPTITKQLSSQQFLKEGHQSASCSNLYSQSPTSGIEDIKSKPVATRAINDSRIKLRDYLFMVSTSAQSAKQKKSMELKSCKSGIFPTTQNTSSLSLNQSQLNQSIKARYQNEKYHISNREMGNIFKTELKNELQQLKAEIYKIQNWSANKAVDSNDDIVQLCSMRRNLQLCKANIKETLGKIICKKSDQIIPNEILKEKKYSGSQESIFISI